MSIRRDPTVVHMLVLHSFMSYFWLLVPTWGASVLHIFTQGIVMMPLCVATCYWFLTLICYILIQKTNTRCRTIIFFSASLHGISLRSLAVCDSRVHRVYGGRIEEEPVSLTVCRQSVSQSDCYSFSCDWLSCCVVLCCVVVAGPLTLNPHPPHSHHSLHSCAVLCFFFSCKKREERITKRERITIFKAYSLLSLFLSVLSVSTSSSVLIWSSLLQRVLSLFLIMMPILSHHMPWCLCIYLSIYLSFLSLSVSLFLVLLDFFPHFLSASEITVIEEKRREETRSIRVCAVDVSQGNHNTQHTHSLLLHTPRTLGLHTWIRDEMRWD